MMQQLLYITYENETAHLPVLDYYTKVTFTRFHIFNLQIYIGPHCILF